MSEMFLLVSLQRLFAIAYQHQNLSCHMEQRILQTAECHSAFPPFQPMHEDGFLLTGDHYWDVEKCSILGYEKEYFGYVPRTSPDVFNFAVEEYQPVVYLAIDSHPRQDDRVRLKNCL